MNFVGKSASPPEKKNNNNNLSPCLAAGEVVKGLFVFFFLSPFYSRNGVLLKHGGGVTPGVTRQTESRFIYGHWMGGNGIGFFLIFLRGTFPTNEV